MGVLQDGVPPGQGWGIHWDRTADGMPLEFTQEDCLVMNIVFLKLLYLLVPKSLKVTKTV